MDRIRWWTGTTVLGLTLIINQIPCFGADDEKSKNDSGKATTSRDNDQSRSDDRAASTNGQRLPFLGVMVEELHPAFATHLPSAALKAQGLMVEEIGQDSPAGKAGIKAHDILLSYDDQKLFTPEQFVRLIHSDKPGREVTFGLIREGKSQSLKVKLGERDPKWDQHPFANHPHAQHFGWGWPGHGHGNQQHQAQSDRDNPQWSSFDSLTLKKLDKDRFHASVTYTNKDGKVEKREYDGTRDEIRKKIEQDRDLLPIERSHLMRGLDLEEGNIPALFFPSDQGFDF